MGNRCCRDRTVVEPLGKPPPEPPPPPSHGEITPRPTEPPLVRTESQQRLEFFRSIAQYRALERAHSVVRAPDIRASITPKRASIATAALITPKRASIDPAPRIEVQARDLPTAELEDMRSPQIGFRPLNLPALSPHNATAPINVISPSAATTATITPSPCARSSMVISYSVPTNLKGSTRSSLEYAQTGSAGTAALTPQHQHQPRQPKSARPAAATTTSAAAKSRRLTMPSPSPPENTVWYKQNDKHAVQRLSPVHAIDLWQAGAEFTQFGSTFVRSEEP